MPTTAEIVQIQRLSSTTGWRYKLKPWESVLHFDMRDDLIAVTIETFDVQEMAREDRYKSRAERCLLFKRHPHKWVLEMDRTFEDDDFIPFTYEKFGRRDTAEELISRREWEMLCHRPGTARTPLDSYGRVLQGDYHESEKRIERHY